MLIEFLIMFFISMWFSLVIFTVSAKPLGIFALSACYTGVAYFAIQLFTKGV